MNIGLLKNKMKGDILSLYVTAFSLGTTFVKSNKGYEATFEAVHPETFVNWYEALSEEMQGGVHQILSDYLLVAGAAKSETIELEIEEAEKLPFSLKIKDNLEGRALRFVPTFKFASLVFGQLPNRDYSMIGNPINQGYWRGRGRSENDLFMDLPTIENPDNYVVHELKKGSTVWLGGMVVNYTYVASYPVHHGPRIEFEGEWGIRYVYMSLDGRVSMHFPKGIFSSCWEKGTAEVLMKEIRRFKEHLLEYWIPNPLSPVVWPLNSALERDGVLAVSKQRIGTESKERNDAQNLAILLGLQGRRF